MMSEQELRWGNAWASEVNDEPGWDILGGCSRLVGLKNQKHGLRRYLARRLYCCEWISRWSAHYWNTQELTEQPPARPRMKSMRVSVSGLCHTLAFGMDWLIDCNDVVNTVVWCRLSAPLKSRIHIRSCPVEYGPGLVADARAPPSASSIIWYSRKGGFTQKLQGGPKKLAHCLARINFV